MMARIDRKLVYLIMLLIVIVTALYPIYVPVYITDHTRELYSEIDKISSDDIVLVYMGALPVRYAQMKDGYAVTLWHMMQKQPKLIFCAMEPGGVPLIDTLLDEPQLKEALSDLGYVEGENYVNLGLVYQEAGLVELVQDFHAATRDAYQGTWLDAVQDGSDFDYVIDFQGQASYGLLVQHLYTTYQTTIFTILTAAGYPSALPFLQAGQLKASLNGPIATTEYEMIALSGLNWEPSDSVALAGTFSATHMVWLALIIIGNIGYLGWEKNHGDDA